MPRSAAASKGLLDFRAVAASIGDRAGIRSVVSGVDDLVVSLIAGNIHFRLADGSVAIAVPKIKRGQVLSERVARYALEVLAHGFHDYPARESVRRFLRFIPETRGRERTGLALNGAERMRRWRRSSRKAPPSNLAS